MIRRHISRYFSMIARERTHGQDYFQHTTPSFWTHNGDMETLHNMVSVRVSLIRNCLENLAITSYGPVNSPYPFEGLKILDVGCGGGILSEALARLGATVTGIDTSQTAIDAAREHVEKDPEIRNNVTYHWTDIESFFQAHPEKFDVVNASEVLEHVEDIDSFINYCIKMGNDQASLFFTTINRTWKSYALAIVAAEYILRIIPLGVHKWEDFVKPGEIEVSLLKRGFKLKFATGIDYCPVTRRCKFTDDMSVNYGIHAVKV